MPVKYECDMCLKIFTHKSTFDRHLQRMKPCNPIEPKVVQQTEITEPFEPLLVQKLPNNQCSKCSKHFCNKSSKTRHETKSKCNSTQQELKYKLLEEKIINMEAKMKSTTINNQTINNQTNNNQTNNNQTNNQTINITNNTFVINNYGDENTEYITDAKKIHNIKQLGHCIPEYILMKHFDKEHPENHNVYISNVNNAYAYKFKGNNWNMIKKRDLLLEIITDIEFDIANNVQDLHSKLDHKTIYKIKEYLKTLVGEKDKNGEDKMTYDKQLIYDDIKILLYEKSKLVMKRREKDAMVPS